jgi:CheY-like chemotaxis protein
MRAAQPTPRPTTAPPRRRLAAHVLVAEDNATNRALIARLLESFGCRVTTVADGTDAVALACRTETGFDLLLTDIQMPGLDGIATARAIRAYEATHPTLRRLPIVALTANSFPEDAAAVRAAGMDDLVAKPIDVATLFTALTAVLRIAHPDLMSDDQG